MSEKVAATCSKCGAREEVEIFSRINVREDPSLKAKVKDGSLFLWKCSKCGTQNLARYMTLYHDPDARLMIWCLPDGMLPESQIAAIETQLAGQDALSGYVLRRVSDVGSLIEKVNIFDAGLDDLVIELCKYVTKDEMREKNGPDPASVESKLNLEKEEKVDMEGASLKFFKMDGADHDIVFSFPHDGRMNVLNIGFNVYEDCAGIIRRNPNMIPKKPFSIVDEIWISKFFK